MTRDAFRCVMVNGVPTFPDAPRLESGEIDWTKLGGEPPEYFHRGPDGRKHRLRTRGTVPHPTTGEPTEPT